MLRKAKVGVQFSGANIGWQVEEDVQDQYKLWESQDLRKQAEAVPPVESVEVDSSHPRVPLDLSDQRCERILTLLQTREDVWKVAKECQYSSFLFDC